MTYFNKVVLLILIGLFFLLPEKVGAAPYGEGAYDQSAYGVVSTPTPTPGPSIINTISSFFSSNSNSSCTASLPGGTPLLFQVERVKKNATISITPSNQPYSRFTISYGFSDHDERYSVSFPKSSSTGVIQYTIQELSPSTTYYFKVRAENDCAPGSWSPSVIAKGVSATSNSKKIFYLARSYSYASVITEIGKDVVYKTVRKAPVKQTDTTTPKVTQPKRQSVPSTSQPVKAASAPQQKSLLQKVIDVVKFW